MPLFGQEFRVPSGVDFTRWETAGKTVDRTKLAAPTLAPNPASRRGPRRFLALLLRTCGTMKLELGSK